MTQEEKELVIKDLCGRLPYGVILNCAGDIGEKLKMIDENGLINNDWDINEVKPYLRPMSSMTEEEKKEYQSLCEIHIEHDADDNITYYYFDTIESFDWLNKNMFDYRGLIPKGQALSTEEFNPYTD